MSKVIELKHLCVPNWRVRVAITLISTHKIAAKISTKIPKKHQWDMQNNHTFNQFILIKTQLTSSSQKTTQTNILLFMCRWEDRQVFTQPSLVKAGEMDFTNYYPQFHKDYAPSILEALWLYT